MYQSWRKLSLHTLTLVKYDYGSASSLQMHSSHPVHLRWDQLAGERWAYQAQRRAWTFTIWVVVGDVNLNTPF